MNFNIRKILFAIYIIGFATPTYLKAEVGDSEPQNYVPRPRTKPQQVKPKKSEPLTSSKRPYPRDVSRLQPADVETLRSFPCPGTEYCPSPFRDFTKDGQHHSPLCREFIGETGFVNDQSVGLMIYEAMKEVEKANAQATNVRGQITGPPSTCKFENDISFGRACPNYPDLSPLQKQHVWLWLWAGIAQAESSCDIEKETKGIFNEALQRYNIASGLFGLEDSMDTRKTNGRDPRFCSPDAPVPSVSQIKNNPEKRLELQFFQTRCAASTMFDTSCGKTFYGLHSYWEESLSFSRKVSDLIARHPLCNWKPSGSTR